MTTDTTHLIVGASLAGAKAAETLRAEGFDGPLVMVGQESERPYERPPLSKELPARQGRTGARYTSIRRSGTPSTTSTCASASRSPVIHPGSHEVSLADGSRTGYSKLLLATGSSPRRLPVPGADLGGVLYLRTVEDSDRIKAAFQDVVPGRGDRRAAGSAWRPRRRPAPPARR